jgi:hypothetical protein
VLVWLFYALDLFNFVIFVSMFFILITLNWPKRFLSPHFFLYSYYGLFFILAPMYAERYSGLLSGELYLLAFSMLFTVLTFAVLGLNFGQRITIESKNLKNTQLRVVKKNYKPVKIYFLYIVSSFLIVLIILNSGGFQYWINAPGDAFLNRAGTGIYVVLSHFFSFLLATFSGYYAYKYKNFYYVLFFLSWLVITSPVHGSKVQISILLLIALLPWVRNIKPISKISIIISSLVITIFFLGLYFRNISWIEFGTLIPYSLNYFSTLGNLVISLRDFDPGFLTTFFLPFNKFTTIFGNPDMIYYDMNHYLTDIYFPSAWEIRATEQWPVETDLYLNFGFFGGLPLIFLYFSVMGFFYSEATKTDGLGHWLIAVLFMIFMVSHLRGSLYNHVDFYFYPMMIVLFYLTRGFNFMDKNDKKH